MGIFVQKTPGTHNIACSPPPPSRTRDADRRFQLGDSDRIVTRTRKCFTPLFHQDQGKRPKRADRNMRSPHEKTELPILSSTCLGKSALEACERDWNVSARELVVHVMRRGGRRPKRVPASVMRSSRTWTSAMRH